MITKTLLLFTLFLILLNACTTYTTRRSEDTSVKPTLYEDISTPGSVSGIGIESQDIASMTDRMMRDMLATPALAGRIVAPRVVIDNKDFINESSSIINKNLITERLMVHLNRAAASRMVFVERVAAEMVEKERLLKREGIVSEGTMGNTAKPAGADFKLMGKIMSLDSIGSRSGASSRYHQISFKMVDLETGIVVWSGIYEFKKTSQDDIIYR